MRYNGMSISKSDRIFISNLAGKVVRYGMAAPVIFFLDMLKYLSFLGGQALVFIGPFMTIFVQGQSYYRMAELFEDRNNIEFLLTEIERLDKSKQLS